MSTRERDRLKVLHEAEKGHLTQKPAGVQLKLSERWVRKLVGRLRKEGDGGILHRLRGRASKRKLSATVRAKVVRLVKREYPDFGRSSGNLCVNGGPLRERMKAPSKLHGLGHIN